MKLRLYLWLWETLAYHERDLITGKKNMQEINEKLTIEQLLKNISVQKGSHTIRAYSAVFDAMKHYADVDEFVLTEKINEILLDWLIARVKQDS